MPQRTKIIKIHNDIIKEGWLPYLAPLGYLNAKFKDGESRVIRDPQKFHLVKKTWKMMISGKYTAGKIAEIIRNEENLNIPRSSIYALFKNPFYYGFFEYPKGSNNWHQGKHEPMINKEEFDLVQKIIKETKKIRIKKYDFPYSGLLRCGECGAMITVEEKKQVICSECRYKFTVGSRDKCPKCKISISDIQNSIHHYIYYHCTKRKNPDCSQKPISLGELEKQIEIYLSSSQIERFKNGNNEIKTDILRSIGPNLVLKNKKIIT